MTATERDLDQFSRFTALTSVTKICSNSPHLCIDCMRCGPMNYLLRVFRFYRKLMTKNDRHKNTTSSTKPEVHNISQSHRTALYMHRTFGVVSEICQRTGTQTNKQTDILITILCIPPGREVIKERERRILTTILRPSFRAPNIR